MLVGCDKQQEQYGQPFPDEVAVVKMEEILKNPQAHKDRGVVLEGNYGGHCCPTDFIYKEELEAVECYYPGLNGCG